MTGFDKLLKSISIDIAEITELQSQLGNDTRKVTHVPVKQTNAAEAKIKAIETEYGSQLNQLITNIPPTLQTFISVSAAAKTTKT